MKPQKSFQPNKYIKLELPDFLSGHEKQNSVSALTMYATRQVKLDDHLVYSHAPWLILYTAPNSLNELIYFFLINETSTY